jgi:osmotically-inducible protein OsmY
MIPASLHSLKKASGEVSYAFANIGALLLLTLAVNTAQAAPPVASPSGTMEADEIIAEQVYQALNIDPTHYFRHVEVEVHDGVVTLSGFVWSAPSIYRAEEIAAQVPGVTHVVDRMELERNGLLPHA